MKKITAWLLTLIMIVSLMPTGVLANVKSVSIKGNLDVSLNFLKPLTKSSLENENLKITLIQNGKEGEVLTLGTDSRALSYAVNGANYNVELMPCNKDGVDSNMAPEEDIYFYKIKFIGIPSGSDNKYDIKLNRNNFGEFKTSTSITMIDYAKYVEFDIDECKVSACDVSKDGIINDNDINMVRDNLGKTDFQEHTDVNNDGKVDISDISYVYKNRPKEAAKPINVGLYDSMETTFISGDTIAAEVAGMTEQDVLQIFSLNNEKPVSLKSQDNKPITEENPLVLSVDFSKNGSPEMSMIKISSPANGNAPTEGTAEIHYNDGKKETIPFSSNIPSEVSALLRNVEEHVITINLGKKVAVKKIIFSITSTQNANATLADVANVEFLKDIVPETPSNKVGIIKGFMAEAANESVILKWNNVANMTGYIVQYGKEKGNYTDTVKTEKNSLTIEGLKNLTTYYFVVRAVNGAWEGPLSSEISGSPLPTSAPSAPLGIVTTAGNKKISVSWSTSKNALSYTLYYKAKNESVYRSVNDIKEETYTITNLTNDVEYGIYVTSSNEAGTSPKSEEQFATPKDEYIGAPTSLPTLNKIDNSHITSIRLRDTGNVNKSFYPNGYNAQNVIDGDYSTHYTEASWSRSPNHIITFDQAYEMDYVAYVTRLDSDGVYKKNLKRYNITVWGPDDDLNGPGEILNIDEESNSKGPNKYISVKKEDEGMAILTFPKRIVKQIEVGIDREAYLPASASEIFFYEYYPLAEEIEALFANKSFTKLNDTVTKEQIDNLRTVVDNSGGYFINKSILINELDMAQALFNNDESKLGSVVKVRTDMPTANMGSLGFSFSLNNFQPLGVVAEAGNEIVLYVDCDEKDTPQLVFTQYNPNWNNWQTSVALTEGRNIITVPKLGTENSGRGGSIYITYSGDNKDIVVQLKGGTIIPKLDVTDYNLNDISAENISAVKEEISKYVAAVNSYQYKSGESNIKNSTEVVTRDLLLSIPAQSAVGKSIDSIYASLMAWQKEIDLLYKIHGLSRDSVEIQNAWPKARLNMRYTRLFDGAFMYASSGHIGMGYGSACGMLGSNFGWGISHEIGHVIDQSGLVYLETTNNIYSLFSQVNNGEDFTGTSRLELSNKYKSIYERVSVSAPGNSNDCFTSLGMYWQLHLAFDDKGESSTQFFAEMYKKVRDTNYRSGLPSGLNQDNLLVAAASDTAQKDLTKFFERWGIDVSTSLKTYLQAKGYATENKAIYYLNDEARRYRIKGGSTMADINDISVTAKVIDSGSNKSNIQIDISTGNTDNSMLGYEIIRNGSPIAFTTEKTYVDNIGASNNISFKYEVIGFDKLLNETNKVEATPSEIKINNDITLNKDGWVIGTTTAGALSIDMLEINPISGIKVTGINSGDYSVRVSTDKEVWVDAKVGDLSKNESTGSSYVGYFNKPETTDDTRIWTFDARYIQITSEGIDGDNIDIIEYPGDNVTMDINAIGKLQSDFVYDNGGIAETIPAGTLIVTGGYRGDPTYNIVALKGMYTEKGQLDTDIDTQIEKFVGGYALMFAEVPKDGKVSEISDGFWVFVPDNQKDIAVKDEFTEEGHKVSLLPNRIKAELYRSVEDNPTDLTGSVVVSNTVWISSPSSDTMPLINLVSGDSSTRNNSFSTVIESIPEEVTETTDDVTQVNQNKDIKSNDDERDKLLLEVNADEV